MKKFAALFVASAAFTALSASAVQAQTTPCPDGANNLAIGLPACNKIVTLTTTVNDILLLTVGTPAFGLGNPTSVNYGAEASNAYLTSATPLLAATTSTVSVTANRAFEVSIGSPTSFSTSPSGVSKPTSDVQWRKGVVAFAALTTGGAVVMSKAAGTTVDSETLSFQSRWAFERDKPGTYELVVTLTLAAK